LLLRASTDLAVHGFSEVLLDSSEAYSLLEFGISLKMMPSGLGCDFRLKYAEGAGRNLRGSVEAAEPDSALRISGIIGHIAGEHPASSLLRFFTARPFVFLGRDRERVSRLG